MLVAVAVAAAGCGGGDATGRVAFTQVEVQAYLEREAARTFPGLTVGAATCPADLPQDVGGAVTCTVVVERTTLDYEVQRLVGGRFEARPQRPIVLVRDIAAAVRTKLEAPAAEVACGDAGVVQPAAGEPLTCQITGNGPARDVTVGLDADGTIVVAGT